VRHSFPADGMYKFPIQNFGIGRYVPGEQIEFVIDGERLKLSDYIGVGVDSRNGLHPAVRIHRHFRSGSRRHPYGWGHLPCDELPAESRSDQHNTNGKSLENNSILRLSTTRRSAC
jgi:hypothetical protein